MGGYNLYYPYCGLGRTYVEVSEARAADGAGVEVCGLLGDCEEVVYFIYQDLWYKVNMDIRLD